MAGLADLTHIAVLGKEAATALAGGNADGCYIDATFGGGGHSRLLLEQLAPSSVLLALDCDEYAAARAAEIKHPRFIFRRCNFTEMEEVAGAAQVGEVRGVLFDLGVSSLQLNSAERGLSFMRDGPLDMRMDRRSGSPAASLLATCTEKQLIRWLKEYGEEPEARRVGRAIYARRKQIKDTATLAKIITDSKRGRPPGRHPATLVFQALRIAVNHELECLRRALQAAGKLLAGGGRLVVIAFHSLEDRIVKRAFAVPAFPGLGRIGQSDMRQVGRAITPDAAEIAANPRARSARMRVFVKETAA